MKKLRTLFLSVICVLGLATAVVMADEDTGRYWSVPGGIFGTTGYLVFVKNTNNLSATQVIYSASLDPAIIAAVTCAEQSFTVTGVGASDTVVVSAPSTTGGVIDSSYGVMAARPSGADTVAILFCNPSAGGIDPAEMNYTFFALSSAG